MRAVCWVLQGLLGLTLSVGSGIVRRALHRLEDILGSGVSVGSCRVSWVTQHELFSFLLDLAEALSVGSGTVWWFCHCLLGPEACRVSWI